MAPRATSISTYIAELMRLLAPQPGRVEFTMRMALICALTVLVAEIYQTPEPALTAYIVFFLNRDSRTLSLIFNVVLVLLITVIIGVIILVSRLVLDDPMWRVIGMVLISFGLLFLASASKLRPIASIIALIIGYALDELGLIQVGELGTRALLYAWLFVGIPAGVSIVVNFLLAPSPRRLAERAIALHLNLAAAMLRTADQTVREHFRECLREGEHEVYGWLDLADREKTSPAGDIAALKQATGSTMVLLSALDVMDRNPEGTLPIGLREYLAAILEEMAAILKGGGYPTEIVWNPPEGGAPLTPLAAAVVSGIAEAIVCFVQPTNLAAPAEQKPKEAAIETKKEEGFFSEDAFTNPEHVYYALKTTGAAIFCYVLYSQLDWSGIHTCFITCYIVSLSTTAETVEKLVLRILGCLIGAAVGLGALIFVLPSLTSIGALMMVIFLGAAASAYVVAGSPRISYIGFQMAFAFFLSVDQGAAPAFDMTIARDRVIGILIGNLVCYLMFTNLWPVTVGKRIDPAIATLLRTLSAMMTAATATARRALASEAQSALAAIETDIELAGYEPTSIRPNPAWLAYRGQFAEDIGALEGALLLSADREPVTSGSIAGRLQALTDRFIVTESPPPGQSEDQQGGWSGLPLFHIVDAGLLRLEQKPGG